MFIAKEYSKTTGNLVNVYIFYTYEGVKNFNRFTAQYDKFNYGFL